MPEPKSRWGKQVAQDYQALVEQVLNEGKEFAERMRRSGVK